jgi:hypothetical protein
VSALAFKKLGAGPFATVFAITFKQVKQKPSVKRRASLSLPHLLHLLILWPPWLDLIVPAIETSILSKNKELNTEIFKKIFARQGGALLAT